MAQNLFGRFMVVATYADGVGDQRGSAEFSDPNRFRFEILHCIIDQIKTRKCRYLAGMI